MPIFINTDKLDEQIALAGMSHKDFAAYIGMNPAVLSRARHGRPVRSVTLHRIALGLTRLPKSSKVLDGLLTTETPKQAGRRAKG